MWRSGPQGRCRMLKVVPFSVHSIALPIHFVRHFCRGQSDLCIKTKTVFRIWCRSSIWRQSGKRRQCVRRHNDTSPQIAVLTYAHIDGVPDCQLQRNVYYCWVEAAICPGCCRGWHQPVMSDRIIDVGQCKHHLDWWPAAWPAVWPTDEYIHDIVWGCPDDQVNDLYHGGHTDTDLNIGIDESITTAASCMDLKVGRALAGTWLRFSDSKALSVFNIACVEKYLKFTQSIAPRPTSICIKNCTSKCSQNTIIICAVLSPA